MKKRVIGLFILIVILMLPLEVNASFTLGNSSSEIGTIYSPGEKISGWINLSFQNQALNSILGSNFRGNLTLLEVLENNSLTSPSSYSCMPEDCETSYSSSHGLEEKSFSLNSQKKILSVLASGMVSSVNYSGFEMSVGNSPSCTSPVQIDFLDDGVIEWKSNNFTDDFSCESSRPTGCFNPSAATEETEIDSVAYCENITLLEGGKYLLGAWVKKTGGGAWVNGNLKMEIYDVDSNSYLSTCNLPQPSTGGGEVSCSVTLQNNAKNDYYVCVRSSAGGYYTKIESSNQDACGFYSNPGSGNILSYHDYYIFAKGAKYAQIGNAKINQAEYYRLNGEEMNDYLQTYIYRFGGNCTSGCSIPIAITSLTNTNIRIYNSSLKYSTDSGPRLTNLIYDSSAQAARISSEFLTLDLGFANIFVPSAYGNHTFRLYLSGQEILSKTINVAKIPIIKSVFPLSVSAVTRTKFYVSAVSPANKTIVSYLWDFGDDTQESSTSNNSIYHSYSSVGDYTLRVSAIDENGLIGSKDFAINAGSPEKSVNTTIREYRARINNMTNFLQTEPAWYKLYLENLTRVNDLDSELRALERSFSTASVDSDFVSIMANLSEMRVPISIIKGNLQNFNMYFDNNINLEGLSALGAGSVDGDEDRYKAALKKWFDENLEINVSYRIYNILYDDEALVLTNYYRVLINSEDSSPGYLLINSEIKTNKPGLEEKEGYSGFGFSDLNQEIEFISSVMPFNLEIYASPEFKNLDLSEPACNCDGACDKETENWKNCRCDCKPIGLAVFLIILVVIAGLGGYLGLSYWYKRRYENYLFKNKNDLYNLVNFINSSLNKGVSKEEIFKRLKQSGWHSEQITYALKKVRGKNTGMPEIKLKVKKKDSKL